MHSSFALPLQCPQWRPTTQLSQALYIWKTSFFHQIKWTRHSLVLHLYSEQIVTKVWDTLLCLLVQRVWMPPWQWVLWGHGHKCIFKISTCSNLVWYGQYGRVEIAWAIWVKEWGEAGLLEIQFLFIFCIYLGWLRGANGGYIQKPERVFNFRGRKVQVIEGWEDSHRSGELKCMERYRSQDLEVKELWGCRARYFTYMQVEVTHLMAGVGVERKVMGEVPQPQWRNLVNGNSDKSRLFCDSQTFPRAQAGD